MDPKKQAGKSSGNKNKRNIQTKNVLESLQDIGSGFNQSFKNDLLKGGSEDFMRQLLGRNFVPRKISGEMRPGESMRMDDAYSGKHEKIMEENRQLKFLNHLRNEESQLVARGAQELKFRLNALQQELVTLVTTTSDLSQDVQTAAMEVETTTNATEYEIGRVERMIKFVQSFRIKISNSKVWMGESGKRKNKKNFWNQYKKKGSGGGASHLLNADHYNQRSAG